jgi:hypothetical protein
MGDVLDTFQSLVSAGDTLRNATVADVVGHVLIWSRTVLAWHNEGLLGTRGRGTQKGQITCIAEAVIRIIKWMV